MANLIWILSKLDLISLIDILLVAAVIYLVLWLVRGTQAVQVLRGVILLALIVAFVGSFAGLTAFNWLLRSVGQALAVVVAVILQPELRRALDRLGRAGGISIWSGKEAQLDRVISEIATGVQRLANRRHGALIVIERETGLQDHIETGIEIDSEVGSELLQTIFFPGTTLHDGAVIIRGDRIVAAACVLPMAETIISDRNLGTRHRAAVGITEQSDAISIMVSEETGIISMARNGRIVRHLDEHRLTTLLEALLKPEGIGRRRTRRLGRRSEEREGAATNRAKVM
ncbi:MAG: TIGR00159 family protein [Chloroflexi bacterium RBG_13_56_8]|nr:MAG: TIGR00159 family protein [Chloroflexi bacterium RBG_13_56_8]